MIKIYNLVFYASYKVMLRSKNFDDFPVLGGVIFVSSCIVLNIGAIILLAERILGVSIISFSHEKYSICKVLLASAIVFFSIIYYNWKGRYKKIIKYYDGKKIISFWSIIIIYMTVSFLLLLLAGLFKNQDWIFK